MRKLSKRFVLSALKWIPVGAFFFPFKWNSTGCDQAASPHLACSNAKLDGEEMSGFYLTKIMLNADVSKLAVK